MELIALSRYSDGSNSKWNLESHEMKIILLEQNHSSGFEDLFLRASSYIKLILSCLCVCMCRYAYFRRWTINSL